MSILQPIAFLSFLSTPACAADDPPQVAREVSVEVVPAAPVLQRHRSHLALHCDFRIRNDSDAAVTLVELELNELDRQAKSMRRRVVNGLGTAPSMDLVVNGPVPAHDTLHIFNPLHRFELDDPPAALEFVFTFQSGAKRWTQSLSFEAVIYESRTELRIPLDGLLRVWDGHDYLSHHRRLGWDHPVVRSLGATANAGRYAYDFVLLGPDGEETHGNRAPQRPEDWYGWGAPVLAPGDGRVVAAENDFPDSTMRGGLVLRHARVQLNDMTTFAGNHVVIDHGNGEFSTLGHLRRGSVVVEPGDEVRAGDLLGEVGLSGSVTHVHLHYQLQSLASFSRAEGLPGSFSRYRLHRGSTSRVVTNAPADTGDVLEHIEDDD